MSKDVLEWTSYRLISCHLAVPIISDWVSLFHQVPSDLTVTHIVLWVYSQHEIKIDHIYFHYMFQGFLQVIQQHMSFQRKKVVCLLCKVLLLK